MTLLGNQDDIRAETPMPVDSMDNSSKVYDVALDPLVFYYNNAGTKTLATGEAAGILIYAKLAYDGVLNSLKNTVGNSLDTSVVYAGTSLTTLVRTPGQSFINSLYKKTFAEKFTAMTAMLTTPGEYYVDHDNGCIWGLSGAIITDTDTATYSVKTPVQGGSVEIGEVTVGATTGNVGFSTIFDADADETAQVIKAGAGNLYKLTVDNADPAAKVYVQLFDLAAISVTVGTTTPKYVIPVPAGAMYDSMDIIPMKFGTAITYAVTSTATGAGAPGATITLSAGYL